MMTMMNDSPPITPPAMAPADPPSPPSPEADYIVKQIMFILANSPAMQLNSPPILVQVATPFTSSHTCSPLPVAI